MSQTVLSVVLEVEPASVGLLSKLIEQLKASEDVQLPGDTERYLYLKESVPSLHFISMSVFEDPHYDPVFVIEANFDGPPGPFWVQLEAAHGERLRGMVRCCKRPSDEAGPLYDVVTATESRRPVAPYLEARTLRPSVFHQGNRGLTRDRILREGELFLATRIELAQANPAIPNPYRGMAAQQIHGKLRAALLPRFAWLGQAASARITPGERLLDWLRVLAFALAVLFCLSTPGFLLLGFLWILVPQRAIWVTTAGWGQLALFVGLSAVAGALLYSMWPARAGEAAPRRSGGLRLSFANKLTSLAHPLTFTAIVLLLTAICAFAMSLVATPLVLLATGFWSGSPRAVVKVVWWPTFR